MLKLIAYSKRGEALKPYLENMIEPLSTSDLSTLARSGLWPVNLSHCVIGVKNIEYITIKDHSLTDLRITCELKT